MSPAESLTANRDDFKKSLGVSLTLHGLLLLIAIIKVTFYSKPLIDLSQAISVSIAESPNSSTSKLPEKVDPVAAPPTPATPETKEAKVEPKPPKEKIAATKNATKEEINLSKVKNKQKAAFEKIKKMSAIEKIKEDLAKESSKKSGKSGPRNIIIKAGTPLTGIEKIEATDYLQSLDYSIKQFWTLPQWLAVKKLKAQVLVKFNTAGQLLSAKIILSSGNSSYDNYCLEAINKAAPFPKVPEKFSEKFSVDGMVVGFPE